MLHDFQASVDVVKKRELQKRASVHYLFFVATLEQYRGLGQASKLMRDWQEQAAAQNTPIWLEATTASSHKLYLKLGFEDVEQLRIGKGKVGTDGLPKKDGEGIPLWCMIWTPEGYESVR